MKRMTVSALLLFCLATIDYSAQKNRLANSFSGVPQYAMDVRVLPEARRLEVKGTVVLPPVNEVRQTVQLSLSDVMGDLQIEVLQPKVCAGPAAVSKKEEREKTVSWTIQPAKPIPAGEALHLRFSCAGGEEIRFVFHIGTEGSFAGGFNTAWYPKVEDNAKSLGKINFSVPPAYQVIATGKRRSATEQEAQGNFAFEITQPSMFSFAMAKYIVERRLSRQGVYTSAYLLRSRAHIGEYLDKCTKVIDVLVQEFGPNPYEDFALVEVPTEQASKASFAGASFEGFIFSNADFLDKDFNTAYYGHEIAHQWWGVSIGRKSGLRGRLMLDEAMAQYGSLRAVEMLEGPRAAERYRRTGYPGYIALQNATGYFMVEAGGFDQPLSVLQQGQYSRILADGKGFIVYDMLSRTIGREKFSRILQAITKQYAAGSLGWDEFLQAVSKGAGFDLQWFYNQWFEGKGAPEWELSWQQTETGVRGVVTQVPPYFRATVEVLIEGDDYQTSMQSLELRGERTEFAFPVKFRARTVTVDPHFLVLHRTPAFRALKSAFGAHIQARGEREKKQYEAAEKILLEALAKEPEPDIYGARFTLRVALGQLFLDQKKFAEAKAHLESALASPSRRAEVLPWAYLYLAQAANGLKDTATLKYAVEGAISAETALGGDTGAASEARSLLAK
jgi:aminopeptidase N